METRPFAYDAVAYPTRPQPQIHPERLAALGLLHGLQPAPVGNSRILELGCGDALNLVAVAAAFPNARCVGLDLSASAIERGRALARACGLERVELNQADVSQPGIVTGQFDYIVAHGLYAWVPEEARRGILALCRDHLAPNGLALISYNALPGACVRQEIRQMLRWHIRDLTDPEERLTEARALVEFLSASTLDNDDVRVAFRHELATAQAKDPGFFFHDDLADHYAPLYFHEFMAQAKASRLQFVADADPAELVLLNLPDRTRQIVAALSSDRIEQQQYLDFVVGRRFRHTILCHANLPVAPELQIDRARDCWFSSQGRVQQPEKVAERGAVAVFERPGGLRLETDFFPGKIALQFLANHAPGRVAFSEIARHVGERCEALGAGDLWTRESPDSLTRFLIEACTPRVATIHGATPNPCPGLSDHPLAFPLARVQAAGDALVTNCYHQSVRLDDRWSREIIAHADGTRSSAQLIAELDALAAGAAPAEADLWRSVRGDFPTALDQLKRRGLLVR
jgi:2-polyprenyl-3-methyl-5-hydroxy-6-metoxy-1,4-benzoquinol methylase